VVTDGAVLLDRLAQMDPGARTRRVLILSSPTIAGMLNQSGATYREQAS
jgi:hypothetical protein